MGRSSKFRVFMDDGRKVSFSRKSFSIEIKAMRDERRQAGDKCTLDMVYNQLAEGVKVSPDAVKNWYKGSNGPGDLDMIKSLANAMGISYKILLTQENLEVESKVEGRPQVMGMNEEKDIILTMHDMFVEHIYRFEGTANESEAMEIYEDPIGECKKSILQMYKYLDKASLRIKNETFKKLRRIITEMDTNNLWYESVFLRPRWAEINPRIASDDFQSIYDGEYEDTDNVPEGEMEDYADIMHMYLEDMGEYAKPGISIIKNDEYTFSEIMEGIYSGNKEKYSEYIKDVSLENHLKMNGGVQIPFSQIVAREMALTLKMVMAHDFPEYFAECVEG